MKNPKSIKTQVSNPRFPQSIQGFPYEDKPKGSQKERRKGGSWLTNSFQNPRSSSN
jgi:hypothetical protein